MATVNSKLRARMSFDFVMQQARALRMPMRFLGLSASVPSDEATSAIRQETEDAEAALFTIYHLPSTITA